MREFGTLKGQGMAHFEGQCLVISDHGLQVSQQVGVETSFKFRIEQHLAAWLAPAPAGIPAFGEQAVEKESRLSHARKGCATIESMEYRLQTDVSEFVIRQEPLGLWDLWIDGMPTLTFSTPEDAARAVYEQDSGYIVWDQLEEHSAPQDLSGWERVGQE